MKRLLRGVGGRDTQNPGFPGYWIELELESSGILGIMLVRKPDPFSRLYFEITIPFFSLYFKEVDSSKTLTCSIYQPIWISLRT
jgi:hypothetical protein